MSRLVRVLDDKDVVERLRSIVKSAGGQSAFAMTNRREPSASEPRCSLANAYQRQASLKRSISASFMLILIGPTA